ncbi:MAG: ABC transporter substrate-binding protein [Methanomicrobiales archaeon]|nr:ABC transporter substrate-binding protein [Methanomicrobiales archaeon]
MSRTFPIIVAIMMVALLCAGCSDQSAQTTAPDAIRVGVVASLTGSASSTGNDIWQSAVLAAEEINANGGVYVADIGKSLPIRVFQGDDESTREGGQKAVSKLITQDNVNLLVGGFSSAVVMAHQSIVADYSVPYIISGASSTAVSSRDDIDTSCMFYLRPSSDDSSIVTTLYAGNVLRPAINEKFGFSDDRPLRLAIIYQDSPYGKGHQSAIHSTIESNGLNIDVVSEESFTMGESDFRTILTAVKAKQPDAIYAVTFLNEQIPLVQQARRDVGLDTIFLTIEPNDDPDYYAGVGRYGEYSLLESRFSPYAVPSGPTAAAVTDFVAAFDARWDDYPGMMGAATYESMYVAAQAIENAGTLDKAAVRDALDAIEMPQMIEAMKNGVITFSDDCRVSSFELYMSQLIWDETAGEPRPKIIWPDSLKETDLVLPDWYAPGSA